MHSPPCAGHRSFVRHRPRHHPASGGRVNNAGIGVFGPLELIPVEQFRRQLEVNVVRVQLSP